MQCGHANYKHLYILPSRWLYLLQFEKIGEEIYENLQNAYCTPLEFLLRIFSTIGIPKSTVLVIIFRVFIWLLSLKKVKKSIIRFQSFEIVFKKRTRSFYNETKNNRNSLSSSDYETTPKFKKSFGENINEKSDVFMKTICGFIIEAYNELFNNRTHKTYVCIMFIPTNPKPKIGQIISSAA